MSQENIFISWSGSLSHDVAKIIYNIFPQIIQSIKPFLSSEDIEKGSRWFNEISKRLENIKFGILCITEENMNAPWILYEAGALSQKIGRTRLTPLLIGINNSDLQGPLSQFNTTYFNEENIRKLIIDINTHIGDGSLNDSRLENSFNKYWPELHEQFDKAFNRIRNNIPKKVHRTPRNILDEVLTLTRKIEQHITINEFNQQKTNNNLSLDILKHSYLSSIGCIKSYASFLKRRYHDLSKDSIDEKINGIFMESRILDYKLRHLEYILGRSYSSFFDQNTTYILRETLTDIVELFQHLLDENGLKTSNINFNISSDLIVFIDKYSLSFVFYNLFDNAIKYAEDSPDEFRIEISDDENDNFKIISFQDWGIGIPEGDEKMIFDRYYRGPSAYQKHVNGAGLGLTIIKELMNKIGGNIILNRSSKPTEFYILFPKYS